MVDTKDQIDALLTNWHKAVTSCDIDAAVQQKSLT
jgi:ketosteroid isomerase-like protein